MAKAGESLDDLEALRQIAALLEPFPPPERERIIRWAREKLGMAGGAPAPPLSPSPGGSGPQPAAPSPDQPSDLRNFVKSKDPKNDTQFAAVVAYFYRFVAPAASRKDAISPQDLMDACRLADWKRPSRPRQTMLNAFRAGVFDKAGHGNYRLNSVGENLVAMVLPGGGPQAVGTGRVSKQPTQKTKRKSR